ncbi:MAG: sensor histidine kinase [Candidatus Dormibacterales bacterium]
MINHSGERERPAGRAAPRPDRDGEDWGLLWPYARDPLDFVAHEIRAPLAVMAGYCQMILAGDLGPVPEAARRALGIVLGKSRQLDELSDILLEATRAEGDKIVYRIEPVDTRALAGRAAEAFRATADFRARKVRVQGRARQALADPPKLEAILHNLLSNAAKYSPSGTPVDIRVREAAGRVELTVSDRGPGVAPRLRSRLFRRFERLPQPTGLSAPGIGLGLYISRIYAGGMGGDIWVTGRRGGGSTFHVWLPCSPSPPEILRR